MTDDRLPEERPPWEPRTRLEMERENSQLRSTNKRLGESLGWIVDVLLQDESEALEPLRLKKRRLEGLESLSYIRDILMGNINEIDESRLIGEEEREKRMSWNANSSRVPRDAVAAVVVPPPPPLPVAESRPQTVPSRNTPGHSPTGSISSGRNSASPRAPSSTHAGLHRLPPWNYSRSGFSGSLGLPAEALPRVPPAAGQRSGDQTPHLAEVQQDPLGVMR